MARSTSIVQRLPWWAFIVLGGLAYFALSGVELLTPSSRVEEGFLRAVSMLALPTGGTLLFFALVKFVIDNKVRRSRRALLDRQSSLGSLRKLSWGEFEQLVGEAYRRQGYRVMENSTAGADGGVDLVLIRNGKTTLVQCKRWQSNRVSVTLVREHLGVVAATGAQHGIIVCSGGFTKPAVAFAQDTGIELADGDALIAMVSALQDPSNNHSAANDDVVVACPRCSSVMIRRTARRGTNAGREFYGCSRYPNCKGTLASE